MSQVLLALARKQCKYTAFLFLFKQHLESPLITFYDFIVYLRKWFIPQTLALARSFTKANISKVTINEHCKSVPEYLAGLRHAECKTFKVTIDSIQVVLQLVILSGLSKGIPLQDRQWLSEFLWCHAGRDCSYFPITCLFWSSHFCRVLHIIRLTHDNLKHSGWKVVQILKWAKGKSPQMYALLKPDYSYYALEWFDVFISWFSGMQCSYKVLLMCQL